MKLQATLQLIFTAIMAYMLSAISHEVIGHGGMCLALKGQVTVLSSVYFRSSPHSFQVDVAGPFVNLVAGVGIWFYLRKPNPAHKGTLGLVLLFTLVFSLAWFAGSLLFGGLTNTDDWAFAMPSPFWEATWRGALMVGGIVAYHFLLRPAFLATWRHTLLDEYRVFFSSFQLLFIPYLGAGLSASLAASWFAGNSWSALVEGSLEVLGASLPWLVLTRRLDQVHPRADGRLLPIGASPSFLVFVGAAYSLFSLLLGHGLFFQ